MPYIAQSSIDNLFAQSDIEDVVGHYIDLKKKSGNLLEACCPFPDHQEKTPSFVVNVGKGFFKCFGCGKGGNAFQFVQQYEKLSTYETYEKLAEILNIKLEYREDDKEYKEKREKEISYQEILNLAVKQYQKNIPLYLVAKDYLQNRHVAKDDIEKWQLGFANNKNEITGYLKDFGKIGDGLKIDIIRLKDGRHYDYFRDRITIPILDINGHTVGFGGANINGEKPKYINSADSELYNKAKVLFGLFQHQEAIRKKRKAFLNEGYFDVISLARVGITNVIASSGTAFTDEQAKLLKKKTQTIVIFYDGDAAGRKASWLAMNMALKHGFQVFLVTDMPDGMDPDDIVRWVEDCFEYFNRTSPTGKAYDYAQFFAEFESYIEDNIVDALIKLSEVIYESADSSFDKGEAIAKIAESVSYIANVTTKQEYIKEISDKLKINKATFKKEVDKFEISRIEKLKKESPEKAAHSYAPQTKEEQEWYRSYGYWADERETYFGYHFTTKNGKEKISNFLIESLYLMHSHNDSKRIFRIKNDRNVEWLIELPIDSMNSLAKFNTYMDSKGIFVYEGNQAQLIKLKYKVFATEKACFEIKNLGWQNAGFWAMANGIYFDKEFQEIDNHGVVIHNDKNYYIPALSKIHSTDDNRFKNDKKFIHLKKSKVTFKEWSALFTEVFNYGENYNGNIAILFAIAAIFRDIIFSAMQGTFPLMFLFGPPGTGKNQLAYGLLYLFGIPQDQVNLNSTTKAGLTKRLAEYVNSLIFLDEYNNALDNEVIQSLKSFFDGISRLKSEKTEDDKTTSTHVKSSAIVAGQEKPVGSGGALFLRSILLEFKDRIFNTQKKVLMDEMQKKGLTPILFEILNHRGLIEIEFKPQFEISLKRLRTLIDAHNIKRAERKQEAIKIQDRLLNSYATLFTVFCLLEAELTFPFLREDIEIQLFNAMKKQSGMITKSNDVSVFWDVIQGLYANPGNNRIEDGKHFKIAIKEINGVNHNVLFLQFSTVYMQYQKEYRQTNGKPAMDKSSLQDYLKNSPEFLGVEGSTRFKNDMGESIVNSAYLFDYDKLSKFINLVKTKEENQPTQAQSAPNSIGEIF